MEKTVASQIFQKVVFIHFPDKAGHYTLFCIIKITSIVNIMWFNGIKTINQKYKQQNHLTKW